MYAFDLISFANRKRCAVRLVPKRGLSSIGTGVMRTRHRPLFLDTLCLNSKFKSRPSYPPPKRSMRTS